MTDAELDALLAAPLPECDAGHFSVALMEAVAHDAARPARILSWVMAGVLAVVVAAACAFGAMAASRNALADDAFTIPSVLTLLTLILSWSVARSARA